MKAVVAWRIGVDAPDYEAHDLSGKGAERTGGRWNYKGTALVYASQSRALACLEAVVHLGDSDPLPLNRYLVELRIPDELWRARVEFETSMHVGWDAEPPGRVSMNWGTGWARSLESLLAEVPSVIVPEESNVLVNPAHPDIALLNGRKVRKWIYDQRFGLDPLRARAARSFGRAESDVASPGHSEPCEPAGLEPDL